MDSYFPDGLVDTRGRVVNTGRLTGKVVGLYFSASWCPPCRKFTPTLIRAYNDIRRAHGADAFEVVFVSSDRTATQFHSYFNAMPWLALSYDDRNTKSQLSAQFGCSGIPYLVLVDGDTGRVLTKQGRGVIGRHGAAAFPFSGRRLRELVASSGNAAGSAVDDGGGRGNHDDNNHNSNSSSSSSGGGGGSSGTSDLVLVYQGREYPCRGATIGVGRDPVSQLCTTDGQVSTRHAVIVDGVLTDLTSTNGTAVNGKQVQPGTPYQLSVDDEVVFGFSLVVQVRRGTYVQGHDDDTDDDGSGQLDCVGDECKYKPGGNKWSGGGGRGQLGNGQEDAKADQRFMQSKRFGPSGPLGNGGGGNKGGGGKGKNPASPVDKPVDDVSGLSEDDMTCEQLMESEFSKIIGHDVLKRQLYQFYKKVQLDEVRKGAGVKVNSNTLYHMLFMGPPGTGKTTMANLVAKLMRKMQLVRTDKVVFVNNALNLIAQYAGQTAPKVDAKVAEARGGVLFIDEAYTIVKDQQQKDSFGKEAIETIMKHLDPPSCVFIFAGYEQPMDDFLGVNQGLARRIPYRYTFVTYSLQELAQIFMQMLKGKMEELERGCTIDDVAALLGDIPEHQRQRQNAGVVSNWIAFAQIERDDRLTIDDARRCPDLASTLCAVDLRAGLGKVLEMSVNQII